MNFIPNTFLLKNFLLTECSVADEAVSLRPTRDADTKRQLRTCEGQMRGYMPQSGSYQYSISQPT